MADINDNTKNFIDQLSQGNSIDAGEAFKDALRDKVANALDNARKDMLVICLMEMLRQQIIATLNRL